MITQWRREDQLGGLYRRFVDGSPTIATSVLDYSRSRADLLNDLPFEDLFWLPEGIAMRILRALDEDKPLPNDHGITLPPGRVLLPFEWVLSAEIGDIALDHPIHEYLFPVIDDRKHVRLRPGETAIREQVLYDSIEPRRVDATVEYEESVPYPGRITAGDRPPHVVLTDQRLVVWAEHLHESKGTSTWLGLLAPGIADMIENTRDLKRAWAHTGRYSAGNVPLEWISGLIMRRTVSTSRRGKTKTTQRIGISVRLPEGDLVDVFFFGDDGSANEAERWLAQLGDTLRSAGRMISEPVQTPSRGASESFFRSEVSDAVPVSLPERLPEETTPGPLGSRGTSGTAIDAIRMTTGTARVPTRAPDSDEDALRDLAETFPTEYPIARDQLSALVRHPEDPVAWVTELCRRIQAGSPPDRAASRIPLDIRTAAEGDHGRVAVSDEREGSDGAGFAAVMAAYPAEFDTARKFMDSLPSAPDHPERWLEELCRRINAGSPPEAAAKRISLNWH